MSRSRSRIACHIVRCFAVHQKAFFFGRSLHTSIRVSLSGLTLLLTVFATSLANGQTITVNTEIDFNNAINTINSNPGNNYTLNFTGGFTLNSQVADFTSTGSTTIAGNAFSINGGGSYQPFIVDAGVVGLNSLHITNAGTPITINGGTLVGSTDVLTGPVTNDGLLVFNQPLSGTYSDVISGTGSVEISGGPVTFSGLNNYTGGTTVDASSQLIGTTDSLQGAITTNGTVQFDQAFAGTYADVLSGTGNVEISGIGPVTFSGLNAYTGGTTVDNGSTLIGSTDSLQGDVFNNGAVQFDQSSIGTYAGNLTGSGSVEISGGGVVTFSGLNSYSGGSIVDSGSTLVGTTGSIQGVFQNDGAVQFNQSTGGTYSGDMSGSGSVEISGGGPVTFSGLNSYTGGTTVDSDSQLIGTTDSLQGDILNMGALQFSQTTSGTYGGAISGSGSVQISGVGSVTFSGLNSYTGGTTVDIGSTLIGSTDSLQGNFTNNGAVQFDQLSAGTYAGSMIGAGSVQISGVGSVTFSGLNSYTGGTTVDSGSTLIGSTDSLQGAFTNNGAVRFDQAIAGSYNGNMSGTGSVEISGGGPLTFLGLNSYSGGTTIDAGSALIGTTASLQGAISNDGAVQFDQSTSGSYSGDMTGTGTVEISGSGTVTFTGLNSYTGGTTIDTGSTLSGTTDSLQGNFTNNGTLMFLQNINGIFAGNISGTGSVEDVTVGTIRFTGINSYTGGTTVDGGAILIGTTDSLQGSFSNSGTLIFNQSTSGTFSGNISGAGSVEISSDAPITFSGTNSYVGGTSIVSNSTLIGTTSSLQGSFGNDGTLIFDQSTSGTFIGDIAGAGTVEISGSGPITFQGTNSYFGGTTVDNGSSLIGTTSNIQGAINNLGYIQFNQATAGTYDGNMTGTGSVEIAGGGVVTFSGLNSYTGGTTVDSQTVLIGTTSSLQGSILNNGVVDFKQSSAGTFAGSITGFGGVEISGPGPITLTGSNSYTGGTLIDNGSKLIGDTVSLQGNILASGSLQFNQSMAGTYGGVISGLGGVEISGAGPVTFTGSNLYSGGTTIDSGSTLIGTTASLQQGFVNNGSLQFNQIAAGMFIGAISGSGKVEIGGTGSVTFLGTNTYTGGTIVDTGSALIGTTSNIQGSIENDGAIQFNQSSSGTYAGNMSGAGSVRLSGGNRYTFTGTNSYLGGTTVDGGTTLVGSTFSLQGDFTNSGSVQFNQASNGTYAGNMSGTGHLEVSGAATTRFGGVNSYTGGTTVDTGSTLSGWTTSLQGAIANNGKVIFDYAPDNQLLGVFGQVSGTYLGNMTGTGSVEINHFSAVTFSGTNSYTGGTTVDSTSSLIGTTSSLQGPITNNGLVKFDQATSGTYSGDMSGSGAVQISGVGPIKFSGTNSYSGGTTIDHGSTLIGTTQSLKGFITDNGTVKFNQTSIGANQSLISGTGNVVIDGVGPILFTNNQTYTGGTSIGDGSTLILTGSIVGTTSVNSGGTLSGSGTLGDTTVNAGGTIYPHAVVPLPTFGLQPMVVMSDHYYPTGGPLTINGNFHQSTGSTYAAELSPTANDKIVVNGTAHIDSGTTLNVVLDSGTYNVGTKYEILTASGGLSGNYTSLVMSSFAQNITFQELYGANDLQLIVSSNLSQAATTSNQAGVASILDQVSASATGDFANSITQLTTLSSAQLSGALNQLTGGIYPSISTVERQTTNVQMQLLSNRLASLTGPGIPSVNVTQRGNGIRFVSRQASDAQIGEPLNSPGSRNDMKWTTWGQGYGLGGNVGGDGNAGALNYRLGGTLFGVERWFDPHTMVGVLGGYAGTSVGDRQDGSKAQINAYQVGLYELRRMDTMYLSNVDAYSNDSYDVSRPINFGTVHQTASGTSTGNQWAHYTEAGATMEYDDFKLQPFLGFQYMYLNQKGYTESGAGSFDLTTSDQVVNSFRQSFGARLTTEGMWRKILIMPSLAARFQHEYGNGTQLISSSFSGVPTAQFATAGNQTGRNFGLFTLGATAYISEQFSIYGSVDTQVASQYTALIGSGGVQYSW